MPVNVCVLFIFVWSSLQIERWGFLTLLFKTVVDRTFSFIQIPDTMKTLFTHLVLILPFLASAQLVITNPSATYTIDFDNTVSGVNNGQFTGAGFAPSPSAGQLDSDAWRVTGLSDGDGTWGGTHTSGDFARGQSNGNETTGGVYAFQTSTGDYCLGIQPTGNDFTPGDFTLRIQNNTGQVITQLQISYEIKVRNDQDRSNSFNFSYSTDDATYTPVPALDYASPGQADPSPSWVTESRSTTLTGLNVPNGSFLYLKWTGDDVSGTGSRDEFGLDDVVISNVILPVELVSFEGRAWEDGIMLTWTTASERDNSHFEIEHGTTTNNFQMIGRIEGRGSTSSLTRYQYHHTFPSRGVNYYRLRQIDFDGTAMVGPVISVYHRGHHLLQVFPTLFSSYFEILLPETTEDAIPFELFDMYGRRALKGLIPAGSSTCTVGVADLPEGPYLLVVENKKAIEKHLLIKGR